MDSIDLYVGIDWASTEHAICLIDTNGEVLEEFVVEHDAQHLEKLCQKLLSRVELSSIAIAIEVPHGAVVETLQERGFAVYSINPRQLDRFRDRFSVAGAKDDRLDARVLASSLRTDPKRFHRVKIPPAELIELREYSRMRSELVAERTRLSNRIRAQLERYYPQFRKVYADVSANWMLALWNVVPTPQAAQSASPSEIAAVLKKYRIRRIGASEVLEILKQPPLKVVDGTTQAATAHINVLNQQLQLINRQLRSVDKSLEDSLAKQEEPGQNGEQRDATLLRSLPGVGKVVAATLLSEALQPLEERDYSTLRALTGVAPVTRRSGKKCQVGMRRACNPRLRDAMYHWARVAAQRDPHEKKRYASLRARGKTHGHALRIVGDRMLSVACGMLNNATLYDPGKRRGVATA